MTAGLAGGSAPSTPMAKTDSDEQRPTRSALVQVRVRPSELAVWRSKAASAGVPLSVLIRRAMARTSAWTPPPADAERAREREVERVRTAQIARIGNNINQVAAWANTYKSSADAGEVLVQLVAIEQALRDLSLSGPRKT